MALYENKAPFAIIKRMQIVSSLFLFAIGAAFGSFALAMVDRMRDGRDWVRGRSECESCKTTLKPGDLIPVFSWLLSFGKCRYCGVKLKSDYPVAELLSGTAFALSYIVEFSHGSGVNSYARFAIWLFAIVIMVALVIYDLRDYLLPDKLVYPLIGLSACYFILNYSNSDMDLARYCLMGLLSVAVSSGIFGAFYLISKGKWIGGGDVKLGIAIGLFLGAPLLSWYALFLSSVLGSLSALGYMATGTKDIKGKKIPFGPYLIVGLFITFLWGQAILDLYFRQFIYI